MSVFILCLTLPLIQNGSTSSLSNENMLTVIHVVIVLMSILPHSQEEGVEEQAHGVSLIYHDWYEDGLHRAVDLMAENLSRYRSCCLLMEEK